MVNNSNTIGLITRTFNVKFDHFSMPVTESELLEIINNKINELESKNK